VEEALSEQQEADMEKSMDECESRMNEVK